MWARVDDGWWCHPKTMGLDLAARGLWVSVLSWSCAQRTSTVPANLPTMLGSDEATTKQLEANGLWHGPGHDCPSCDPVETGWIIHNWREYQDKSLSEKRSEAGSKGGKASGKARATRNEEASNREAAAKQQPKREPVPSRPVPEVQVQEHASPDLFEDWWGRFPRGRAGKPGGDGPKKTARKSWDRMSHAQHELALSGVDHYRAHVESEGGPYAAHASTWLNQERWEQWQEPAEKAKPDDGVSEFSGTTDLSRRTA